MRLWGGVVEKGKKWGKMVVEERKKREWEWKEKWKRKGGKGKGERKEG